MDGFTVLDNELTAHMSRLNALGDRLDTALDAANQVTLGTEAYGVICQFFVPVVQAVSQPGTQALGDAAAAVEQMASGVRDTLTGYNNTDRANTRPFTGNLT
ncbi:hypothetical protein JOD54_004891 [Actinokineospora baliensis]|uniref:type VII secretion target n=1 Tax=Actinokineospora baliensis TaxID=547056 RepID=UPI00195B7A93|nr:type VII secretion target [Actinokineospora baliensis]MBM7774687.1 hypothetical protein [Actinokineospora baliensis]